MIKFRQKEYTLQEGHYTGPKDMDKVPGALEVIGKDTLVGTVIGGAYGKLNKSDDISMMEGAWSGAKWGSIGGIVHKMFLNHIHKPMTSVKYQDVDRNIRRQFGIFRMAGVTVGDTFDKRTKLSDRFSFNDRDVSKYKINIAIHRDQVTMYTLGLTSGELDKVNEILDYYCKKYFGMEYSSRTINSGVNSYAADIAFTNVYVLSNFIIELANTLSTKVNLLDNNAIVDSRIRESINETTNEGEVEKTYSLGIEKQDLINVLKGVGRFTPDKLRNIIPYSAMGVIVQGLDRLHKNDLQKLGILGARGDINNQYLLDTLQRLRFIEGFHYTRGEKKSDFNISISQGLFIVTVLKGGKIKMKDLSKYFNKSEFGKVEMYTYAIQNDQEFRILLGKILKLGKPNIYEDKV
jgi:hypothetical protein